MSPAHSHDWGISRAREVFSPEALRIPIRVKCSSIYSRIRWNVVLNIRVRQRLAPVAPAQS